MNRVVAPVEVMTKQESVYKGLLEAVVSGRLPPGAQITLTQLSEQFGVSLMPVREALRKLEAQNFITINKNRRVVIRELSGCDLNELLQIRLKLECMAATKAVENVDDKLVSELERIMKGVMAAKTAEEFLEGNKQFHHTLYKTANMPVLQETIENLWGRLSPYLHIYTTEVPDYKTLKIKYHIKMLEGIRERNPRKVCKWLAIDLRKAAELVNGLLKKKPD